MKLIEKVRSLLIKTMETRIKMPVMSCLKEYSVTLELIMVIMQQINLSVKVHSNAVRCPAGSRTVSSVTPRSHIQVQKK